MYHETGGIEAVGWHGAIRQVFPANDDHTLCSMFLPGKLLTDTLILLQK